MTISFRRPSSVVAAGAVIAGVALVAAGCGAASGTTSSSSSSAATTPASAVPAAAHGTAVVARSRGLGRILTDASGRTLYLWRADRGRMSTCNGACASAWPPLITHGAPHPGAGVTGAKLGVTRRANGAEQVTYAGHPLYLFAGDSAAGQTNGQGSLGFGAAWFVVSPSGAAITHAQAATASATSSVPGY